MQLYPAIDMKGGKCVRLTQGLFDNVKVYSDTPADMAKLWVSKGATFLHIVDLDGALAGYSVNEAAIRAIAEAVDVPIELGGGIRSTEAVEYMLGLGISRCIIGTKAVENPEWIRELVERFGADRIVVGVDAKDGMVAVEGWEKVSSLTALDLCLKMKEYGVKHIVYTDISRDGMLSGPNVEATRLLTEKTGMDIIASGGVSCMEDLDRLNASGIQGAIIGKALYENRIDLEEAVKRFEHAATFTSSVCWSQFKLNSDGLIPVIVQDDENNEVLMMAYMNEQAFLDTLETGMMHYYSRSRKEQWFKGETSGHFQHVRSLYLDCDNDTLLARITQIGAACHTGSRSCFFQKLTK
jgi:phosphoribosylformimino-5-aminoimidazole carboxamide ribotide isomerase